jgi:hypothetical protein
MLRRLRRRVRYWLQREERDRLLREELEIHIQMKALELEEQGMLQPEARDAARRGLGNLGQIQADSRSTWISIWFTDLIKDSAFAVRMISKQPSFAALACLSAALGIGACFVDLRARQLRAAQALAGP